MNKRAFLSAMASILAMAANTGASAGLFGIGGTSWKEEVLLHDGSQIVVERWAKRGGRHEIGQQPPIREQTLTFSLPGTNERIEWKSEYSPDTGLADFKPILLDFVDGDAYVVATPVGCLSYNKWGRPNPPYVIFKYQETEWQQTSMRELPLEIQLPNLIISSPDREMEKTGKGLASADEIKKTNNELTQIEYRKILREPLAGERILDMCEERVLYKGYWIRPDDPIAKKIIDRRVNSSLQTRETSDGK